MTNNCPSATDLEFIASTEDLAEAIVRFCPAVDPGYIRGFIKWNGKVALGQLGTKQDQKEGIAILIDLQNEVTTGMAGIAARVTDIIGAGPAEMKGAR